MNYANILAFFLNPPRFIFPKYPIPPRFIFPKYPIPPRFYRSLHLLYWEIPSSSICTGGRRRHSYWDFLEIRLKRIICVIQWFVALLLWNKAYNHKTHGRLIEPPALFLCTWYLVTWSLYFTCCFFAGYNPCTTSGSYPAWYAHLATKA